MSAAADHYIEHEVEVHLTITTTREDVPACLERSGLVVGELIGEALIGNVETYTLEDDEDDDDEAGT